MSGEQFVDQEQCDRRMYQTREEFRKCLDVIQVDLKLVVEKIGLIKEQILEQNADCNLDLAKETHQRTLKDAVLQYRVEILLIILIIADKSDSIAGIIGRII